MRDLSRRSLEAELMDGDGLGDPALQARVLRDLAHVNHLTRTHAPVLQFVRQCLDRRPAAAEPLAVLDVGCGQGDLLRAVHRLASKKGRTVRLTGLDLHPDSIAAALAATPAGVPIDYVCADVLQHDPGAVDCIVNSQLAHHLDDAQLQSLLRWMQEHAAAGWCVADLRRHWLPYLGFRWLARAAGWHRVVRLDGTLSIARSRTAAEWQALLRRAGLQARVERHWPYRLTVQAMRGAAGAADGAADGEADVVANA